jgi:hypothetical protein
MLARPMKGFAFYFLLKKIKIIAPLPLLKPAYTKESIYQYYTLQNGL